MSLKIIHDMRNCFQIRNKQTILEHGRSVLKNFLIIKRKLELNRFNENDPSWLSAHRLLILESLYSNNIMNKYLTLHDCGKPYCQELNEFG